jgi:Starch-binding associating with outer membrane
MNKLLILCGLAATLVFSDCTKKFDSINTDPTRPSAAQFDPNLLLPTVETGYTGAIAGYGGAILYQSMWVQIFANPEYPGYYTNGDKYVNGGSYNSYLASPWNNTFSNAGRAYEIINLTQDKPELSNLSGVALIMELLHIELATDVYGDVPFSQALQAKTGGITAPVYDAQQDIYNSMLAKLDSVIPTLDASKAKPTNDVIYSGDIAKWKKFGYSLMLRMAMRLTKADPATAKTYVEKAYAGGTFASNADNAFIVLDDAHGFSNGNATALAVAEDYTEVRWGKILIDDLKAANDPRLSVISEVPLDGKANAADKSLAGISTPAIQEGMPNGYDQNGGATDITNAPGYPGGTGTGNDFNVIGKYSRPTTALYLSRSCPEFILTYAETELLLAEAAVRGWSVGVSASVHYQNGLSAALQSYGTFNAVGVIDATTADNYAAAHPLDVSTMDNSLQQINTQFWITTGTLFNFFEAWNNWRRSGYPVLTPVNYTGNFSNGTIPRRFIYPSSEPSNNGANYSAAVGNLSGGDQYTSRMYWDK